MLVRSVRQRDRRLLAVVLDYGIAYGLAFGDQDTIILLERNSHGFAGQRHAHGLGKTALAAVVLAGD